MSETESTSTTLDSCDNHNAQHWTVVCPQTCLMTFYLSSARKANLGVDLTNLSFLFDRVSPSYFTTIIDQKSYPCLKQKSGLIYCVSTELLASMTRRYPSSFKIHVTIPRDTHRFLEYQCRQVFRSPREG